MSDASRPALRHDPGQTDLPPLTLAVVLLEEALVVRDAVLAEDESRVEKGSESAFHG